MRGLRARWLGCLRVLRAVGVILQATVRESDIVCRWGQEFLLVLTGTDAHQATQYPETLRARIAMPHRLEDGLTLPSVRASMLAISPSHQGVMVS